MMQPLWLVLTPLLAAGATLGSAVHQDGVSLRPPQGFRMARMELYHQTRAAAVATNPAAPRWLSAALLDGEGEEAATLTIAVVEGAFQATPAARDDFSTAVVRHYADELGLRFLTERAELVTGPPARIEVLGTVRQENQVRRVLVAAMASEGRHAVVTVSAPTGRWDELSPQVAASLQTYRNELAPRSDLPRGVAVAVALVLAVLLSVSLGLWRRRRAGA